MTNEPWQRQPYETDVAFNAFSEYYLVQSPPRQVVEAYNRWRKGKYGASVEQRKQANGAWNNWANGKTYDGNKPENSYTWQTRARAYDDHLAALRLAEYEKRHMGPEEALARLADIARASHANFAGVLTRDDLRGHPNADVIKTIITDTYEDAHGRLHHKMKLELYPALNAIEDILRIHGKFDDKITVRLEKEIDGLFNVLESELSPDDYSRILARLSGSTSGETPAGSELE
jgi:hypothetical protein